MDLQLDNRRPALVDDYLLTWIEAFLISKKAQGVTKGTLGIYREKLNIFTTYCEGQAVKQVTEITPTFIREYLLFLEHGHNPGGVHVCYRVLKTFLLWWEDEVEPEGWKNPVRKVKAPKVPTEPIEGVSLETVRRLVKTCKRGTFAGDRDAAILLALFDTGARAMEFASLNLEDVNQARGDVLIRQGKGRKPRYVYLGKQSRRALRRYLRHRTDDHQALWVIHPRYGVGRLSQAGLSEVLKRRAKKAGIPIQSPHDFRRGFALAMLRNGVDIYTLAKLMGHEGIGVLSHYLKLTSADTAEAHRHASPVDSME